MSKTFGVVSLEDIRPLTDEYGNEYAQRDYSLKANRDYVAELAESMRRKGEPDEPITVIPDGGVYYVRTGRSRYEAMKLLGTRECHAVIDDDTSRKSAIEAIVRTDVKKSYEGVEKSRMVQQLMLFGDDQYVSENAGITVEQSRKARRAREAAGDAAEEMTLDRMYAIAEFADDPEAVEELSACQERDVSWKASQLRAKREKRERRDAFEAAFGALGVPVVADRDGVSGMCYFVTAPEPAEVAGYLPPEWEDGQVAAFLSENHAGVRAEVYVDPGLAQGEEDAEEAELRRMADAYEEALRAMDDARAEWFWANLAQGRPMPVLLRECEDAFFGSWQVAGAVRAMGEDAEAAARNRGLSLFDYAMGSSAVRTDGTRLARYLASGKIPEYLRGQVGAYLDELALYRADGWEPGDAHALVKKIGEVLEGDEDESEGSDE